MLIGRKVTEPDYDYIEKMGGDYCGIASMVIMAGGEMIHNIPVNMRSFYEACGYRFAEVNPVGASGAKDLLPER